jgi:hypothetical protein
MISGFSLTRVYHNLVRKGGGYAIIGIYGGRSFIAMLHVGAGRSAWHDCFFRRNAESHLW